MDVVGISMPLPTFSSLPSANEGYWPYTLPRLIALPITIILPLHPWSVPVPVEVRVRPKSDPVSRDREMKAYIIKAWADSEFKRYKRSMGGPLQNIFSVAATIPKDVLLEMTDGAIDMKLKFSSDADIVAIFMSTHDAISAYEIADKFKKPG